MRLERNDPQFRHELQTLSVSGLRQISVLSAASALFMLTVHLDSPERLAPLLWIHGLLASASLAAGAFTFVPAASAHARLTGCALGVFHGSVLLLSPLALPGGLNGPDHHIPGNIALALLVGIAALPLRPSQTLAIGGYYVFCHGAMLWMATLRGQHFATAHLAETFVVVLLATAVTVTIYGQRARSYLARQRAESALEQLRIAQANLLVSEAAAAQATMAAALSHELNTPLGTLSSINDTLFAILKPESLNTSRRSELSSLEKASREATARLRNALASMKRITNLDRADIRDVDINQLVRDTVGLARSALSAPLDIRLDLAPLPKVRCQPQRVGAALSSLLHNAGASVAQGDALCIKTARSNGRVRIELRTRSTELTDGAEFVSNGTRVTAANWDVATARHCISEQRGTLRLTSTADGGTAWRIHLPLEDAVAANVTP